MLFPWTLNKLQHKDFYQGLNDQIQKIKGEKNKI